MRRDGKLMFAAAGCAAYLVGAANNAGIPFVGPELETIGNTLSTERIIEETLWPGCCEGRLQPAAGNNKKRQRASGLRATLARRTSSSGR